MIAMHKAGPLRNSYIIEKNEALAEDIDAMVKRDNIAQLLMGDELKQDQFEFFYNTTKIIYDSALCGAFINMKQKKAGNDAKEQERQAERIEKEVIPELIAFHSLLKIRDIQLAKAAKAKKDKLKAEMAGDQVVAPEQETEEETMIKKNEKDKEIPLTED